MGPRTELALDVIGGLSQIIRVALAEGRDVTQEELDAASQRLGELIDLNDAKIKEKWGG